MMSFPATNKISLERSAPKGTFFLYKLIVFLQNIDCFSEHNLIKFQRLFTKTQHLKQCTDYPCHGSGSGGASTSYFGKLFLKTAWKKIYMDIKGGACP